VEDIESNPPEKLVALVTWVFPSRAMKKRNRAARGPKTPLYKTRTSESTALSPSDTGYERARKDPYVSRILYT